MAFYQIRYAGLRGRENTTNACLIMIFNEPKGSVIWSKPKPTDLTSEHFGHVDLTAISVALFLAIPEIQRKFIMNEMEQNQTSEKRRTNQLRGTGYDAQPECFSLSSASQTDAPMAQIQIHPNAKENVNTDVISPCKTVILFHYIYSYT